MTETNVLSGERKGSIARLKPAVWETMQVYIEGICLMYNNNSNRGRAAWARGFMAFFAMLAMGLGVMARPAEAQPFAYITNNIDGTVSVIDTATNMGGVCA